MAQPPFLVDAIQIEPGSGQTLTISRDVTDGSLKFVDHLVQSGLSLAALAGLRNVSGVFIVGRGGYGAQYTSIQEALDAIPDASNAALPSLVLILPGVYQENLKVQKDGVYLVGMGATVMNDGPSHTLEILASPTVTPKDVVLTGLAVLNDDIGFACVKISGADAFASGTVTVGATPLATGDLVVVNGTNLVGTAGVRTSGSDNFSVSGGTVDAIAAEIAAAINDPANTFASLVSAESALGVVTVTAVRAGDTGNAITLGVTTVPPGNMVVSGAVLAGGGSAGNEVALNQVSVQNCLLEASGIGGYQIWSDTANVVRVLGGTFAGSNSASACLVTNTAEFRLDGVAQVKALELAYVIGSDRPDNLNCNYGITNIGQIGDITANLEGAGELFISGCSNVGDVVFGGDRDLVARLCGFGAISASDDARLVLRGCSRDSVVSGGGDPILTESATMGAAAFVASASETVVFPITGPDADYMVTLESPDSSITLAVTNKLAASFDIVASGAFTGTVNWAAYRRI